MSAPVMFQVMFMPWISCKPLPPTQGWAQFMSETHSSIGKDWSFFREWSWPQGSPVPCQVPGGACLSLAALAHLEEAQTHPL